MNDRIDSSKYKDYNRIALIDGKEVDYNVCFDAITHTIEWITKDWPRLVYVGTGKTYTINGVDQNSTTLRHFFV